MNRIEIPEYYRLDLPRIDSPIGRVYSTPDGEFPSITTVLGSTGDKGFLDAWRERVGDEKADKKIRDSTVVGTEMHTLIEHHIKEDLTDEEFVSLQKSSSARGVLFYKKLSARMDKEIPFYVDLEVPLYSKDLGISGTTDFIGARSTDHLIIADHKSNHNISRLKKDEEVEDYKIQICAYSEMFYNRYGLKISEGIILMTNGMANQIWNFNPSEYLDKLKYRVDKFYSDKKD